MNGYLDIQVSPISGLPSWIFFSAMDGTDLTQEFASTHPISVNRFKRMLEIVLERAEDEEEYASIFGEPLPEEIAVAIQSELANIDALLNR